MRCLGARLEQAGVLTAEAGDGRCRGAARRLFAGL